MGKGSGGGAGRPARHRAGATARPQDPGRKFAADVLKAARKTRGAERFGGNKAFISDVHRHYAAAGGKASLSEFKQKLGEAANRRHVELSRADMVEAMARDRLKASHMTRAGGAEANFVRVESVRKVASKLRSKRGDGS